MGPASGGIQIMTRLMLISAMIAALFGVACQGTGESTKPDDVTGIYYLVKVDGSAVPTTVSHDGEALDVHSGTFIISADKTCFSRTHFAVPDGAEMTREVHAKYRTTDSRLIMKWENAGTTEGTVEGDTFTMDNHGMIFEYTSSP